MVDVACPRGREGTSAHPVADSFDQVRTSLLPRLRPVASTLPYRIGISMRPDGGWEDFSQLEVLYDMPVVVGRGLGFESSKVAEFRAAHHRAGFYGLVADRIADGQVAEDVALRAVRAGLKRAWEDSLGAALDDAERSRRAVAQAMSSWRKGLRDESSAMMRRSMSGHAYAGNIRRKVRWLQTTTLLMLEHAGERERVPLAIACARRDARRECKPETKR